MYTNPETEIKIVPIDAIPTVERIGKLAAIATIFATPAAVFFSIPAILMRRPDAIPGIWVAVGAIVYSVTLASMIRGMLCGFYPIFNVEIHERSGTEYKFVIVNQGVEVPIEDLVYFLKRVHVNGIGGANHWRKAVFPSGVRGSDEYHKSITGTLAELGLWELSKGPRSPGRATQTLQEAIDTLGVNL